MVYGSIIPIKISIKKRGTLPLPILHYEVPARPYPIRINK